MSDAKDATQSANYCAKCKHEHTGKRFAYICIGCPCLERPGDTTAAESPKAKRARSAAARKEVIGRILAAWHGAGDQRLGQLIVNACGQRDVFYVEDEELAELIESVRKA